MMPKTKYVSIFEINGEPILPPLMTMEKRFEMQMYREKAIQLERKYVHDRHGRRVQFCETPLSESAFREFCYKNSGNTSRASDVDEEDKPSASENSSSALSTPSNPYKLIGSKRERDKKLKDCGTNTLNTSCEGETKGRMAKLSRSKTICFDNTSNTIIRAMSEEELACASGKSQENKHMYLCDMMENANLDSSTQTKKSLHLPLSQQPIPSIFVNPPTPLAGPRNIVDPMSATESVDSYDLSGFQSSQATQNQAVEITEDSAEESTEHEPSTPQKRITSTARSLDFEQVQSEQKNTSPPSGHRCEGGEFSGELCFAMRSPQRSATSPSLKSLSDTIGTCSLTTSPRADDTSAHSLVRSSSFTLEGPSKVLLEHIRQQNRAQNASKESDSSVRSPTPSRQTPSKHRSSPSPSAWRDTVESKAKRVQKKVEVKPNSRTTSKTRSKPKLTFNNYTSSSTPIWNSPLPPLKIKRSPYGDRAAATSTKPHAPRANSVQKYSPPSKVQKSHAVKKSSSSTTYTVKPVVSRSSLPNSPNNTANTTNDDAHIMAEIDKRHHQKLLTLIAQQQEEQRRLQHAFETQQRILLEQLNNERYRHYNIEVDESKSPLHIEGVSNMPATPSSSRKAHHSRNEGNTQSFERVSPTLSVTSSYMSPGFSGVLSGFTTTTTCELPYNVPSNDNQGPLRVVELPALCFADNPPVNGNSGEKNGSNVGSKSPHQSSVHYHSENGVHDLEQLNAAATTINAYARGFLVRRLFQTEQIQRIVQTIRDTLIFVLNLHMETMENHEEANTPANIKLKARLLQQLSSACRTLHLIFFQTSIKERMEIIARDRKRIKTKLLSMSLKRSPRVA